MSWAFSGNVANTLANEASTGDIALKVLVFNGVPFLFTDDGRRVRGVQKLSLNAVKDGLVTVAVTAITVDDEPSNG